MNIGDEYYIPENIEDDFLRSVASMAKEALKDHEILENILRKHIMAYNSTLKEECSAKSLKIMNQNHKFTSMSKFGVIKSPSCSSVCAEKDTKVPSAINNQLRTPLKTNRINSSTNRKRLSFDVAENEHVRPAQECSVDVNDDQMLLDKSASFLKHDDEDRLYDSPKERFKLDGIPECAATISDYEQCIANLSTKTPDKNQRPTLTPKKKNRTPVDCTFKERIAWYLESYPSLFGYETQPKVFDSPNMYFQERFNFQGKSETVTSGAINDISYPSEENGNNYEMVAPSSESENNTLINSSTDDRSSSRCLEISPSFFASKTEVSYKHSTNNKQEPFHPHGKHDSVSSLPFDQQETSNTSNETAITLLNSPLNTYKEEIKTTNKITAKNVEVASNGKECLCPNEDIKTSNNHNMKKRKLVNEPEAIKATNSVTEDQDFTVPSKMYKMNNESTSNDEKTALFVDVSVMNRNDSTCSSEKHRMEVKNFLHSANISEAKGYDSTCSTEDHLMEAKNFLHSANVSETNGNDSKCCTEEYPINSENVLHSADISAMNGNNSFDRPVNGFIVDQDVAQSDGKSIESPILVNNCESMDVSPAKQSERPTYQPSTIQNNASCHSPQLEYDVKNSEIDKIYEPETKDVGILTNLRQNLNPALKHLSDDNYQKCIVYKSASDDINLLGKLCLEDDQSGKTTPKQEFVISNDLSEKANNSSAVQMITFLEMLKQRKTRISTYLRLFAEDQDDFNSIFAYLKMLAAVIKKIPISDNNQALYNATEDFICKGLKLVDKGTLWKSDIKKDIENFEDCIKEINRIRQDIKHFYMERKRDAIPKDLQKWEEMFRIVNKKADDMILLREIRRPTFIQFGYEFENFVKLFIQCMILLGLFKHSSKVSSN